MSLSLQKFDQPVESHPQHADSIEVENIDLGKRFLLPNRDLGNAAPIGWIIVAIGVFVCAFMAFWMWTPIVAGIELLQKGLMFGYLVIAFGAIGLVGLFIALGTIACGWSIVKNRSRCSVEIRNDNIYSIEHFGWLKWRRKCRIKNIDRLQLVQALESKHDQEELERSPLWLLGTLYGISAISGESSFLIAPGYKREISCELGKILSEEISAELMIKREIVDQRLDPFDKNFVDSAAIKTVEFDDVTQLEMEVDPILPADSKIATVNQNGTKAFSIPPNGVKGLPAVLFLMAAFCVMITTCIAFGTLAESEGWEFWLSLLFILIFEAVGIGIFILGLFYATASVMIGIADDQLFIERKSILGTKWIDLPKQLLQSVRLGPSGTTINDEPVNELQFHTFEGQKHGMLGQLDDEEIKWLAFQLNNLLNIDQMQREKGFESVALNDPNWPEPPTGANVRLESITNSETRITIPPVGLRGVIGSLTAGLFFVVAPIVARTITNEVPLFVCIISGLIGLIVMGFSLIYSFRRLHFQVTPSDLQFKRSGLLGSKAHQWSADEISSIQMGSSGYVNENPFRNLIVSKGRKKLLVAMNGRPTKEILYVMMHLRQTLGMTAKVE